MRRVLVRGHARTHEKFRPFQTTAWINRAIKEEIRAYQLRSSVFIHDRDSFYFIFFFYESFLQMENFHPVIVIT